MRSFWLQHYDPRTGPPTTLGEGLAGTMSAMKPAAAPCTRPPSWSHYPQHLVLDGLRLGFLRLCGQPHTDRQYNSYRNTAITRMTCRAAFR